MSVFRTLGGSRIVKVSLLSWVHYHLTGPSFDTPWVCVPLSISLHVHIVPNGGGRKCANSQFSKQIKFCTLHLANFGIFLSLKYFPSINLPASCLSMRSAAQVPWKGWWVPPLFVFSLIQVFLKLSSSINVPCCRAVPYSGHSLHWLVVFICWFASKPLSPDPGSCAPPLLLILVYLPFPPRCSTSTFDLHSFETVPPF